MSSLTHGFRRDKLRAPRPGLDLETIALMKAAQRVPGERTRRGWFQLEERHDWLTIGRVACALALMAAALLVPHSLVSRDTAPLIAVTAGAALLQVLLGLIPRRWPVRLRLAVDASLLVDAAWVSGAAYYSGGSESPLIWLFVLVAVGATLGYSARTGLKSALVCSLGYLTLRWYEEEALFTSETAGRLVAFLTVVAVAAAGAAASERELRRRAQRMKVLHDAGRRLLGAAEPEAMVTAAREAAEQLMPGWRVTVRRSGGPDSVRFAREGESALVVVPAPTGPGGPVGALECRRPPARTRGPVRHVVRASGLEALELLATAFGSALWRVELMSQLERQSLTDALTGLANRRAFDQELARELTRAQRSGDPVALCMMDVDRFKAYNDIHGHQAGDEALVGVGRAVCAAARAADRPARYGGEEVALLLPATRLKDALAVAERVRQSVANEPLLAGGVTVSIGVAVADRPCSPADLVEAADRALYLAKANGRNRIESADLVVHEEPVAQRGTQQS